MTRDQQLEFCKKCTNRKMDLQQGLICAVTGEKATFTHECSDFALDETVKIVVSEPETQSAEDVILGLSDDVLDKLRTEQNLPLAIAAGIGTGILGAILWGVITVATNYQIGFMAIAIGAAVGFAMRFAGKGVDQVFGFTGAAIAVLSCFLGNFLSIIGFISQMENLEFIQTLLAFDYSYFIPVMTESFSVMDLVFYGFAGFEGYKFAFRTFTQEDLNRLN